MVIVYLSVKDGLESGVNLSGLFQHRRWPPAPRGQHERSGHIVFIWPNPDREDRQELKIEYVLPVDETWWVGSGVYLSEITGRDASLPGSRPGNCMRVSSILGDFLLNRCE
jgi:hypothetical protein